MENSMKILSRLNLQAATSKYKKGEFGYWWTVEQGNADIEGKVYPKSIYASLKGLTSLKGAPKEVKGYFMCDNNKIVSLKGSPKKVTGIFNCGDNPLTSLKGGPEYVGESYMCGGTYISDFDGLAKEIGKDLYCQKNPKLKSLENNSNIKGKIISDFGWKKNPWL